MEPTGTLSAGSFFCYTIPMISRAHAIKNLKEDAVNICVSVLFAWFLISSGTLSDMLSISNAGQMAQSFIAGLFFTSAFTIAPASIFLAGLSQSAPLFVVAFFGALGAMCGDLILFLFIRDRLASDIEALLKRRTLRRLLHSFHLGFWKWLAPLLGGLIIASPLPDEFGLSLLGLSRTRLAVLLPLSFVMNFIGILLVAGVASVL